MISISHVKKYQHSLLPTDDDSSHLCSVTLNYAFVPTQKNFYTEFNIEFIFTDKLFLSITLPVHL